MAIGRTFKEALQKGFRGLETDRHGWVTAPTPGDDRLDDGDIETVRAALRTPDAGADLPGQAGARRAASASTEISERTRHRPLVHRPAAGPARRGGASGRPARPRGRRASARRIRTMKRLGFSDKQLALLDGMPEDRGARAAARPRASGRSTRRSTPAPASSRRARPTSTPRYDEENESAPDGRPTVVILGSGPNRIGQGVEFDYCCVRAVLAFRRARATAP